jgi:hypothetical protein
MSEANLDGTVTSRVSTRHLLWLALIIALAAVLRFPDLEYAGVGGHGDVAWIGINALDWVDSGVWPYYVRELYAPEPLIVYLTGLAIPLAGVSFLAPRLVTVIFGLLLVAFVFPATWWLLDGAPSVFRGRASLLASLAAAMSLHAMYLSRLGMRSPLLPAVVALLIWLTAWAWRRGGRLRWALAGVALAFAQYTFIPARLLPIVLALWIAHGRWADRERMRAQWSGWLVMAVISFVLTLPNIITFIATPEAFSARADVATAESGGWIWAYDTSEQGGVLAIMLQKLALTLLAFGIHWDGPYTIMAQPMLTPLFYLGLLVALGALVRWPRRIAYAWPSLAIPVMLITDLISGTVVEIHALHQIGILPFVFILAGLGLAHMWNVLDVRVSSPGGRRVITGGLLVVALAPSLWGTYRYLTDVVPDQYADPETGWRLEQTDVDISRRLISRPESVYLVPYEEYSRSNIAWMTSDVFRDRHSAIDASGILRVPDLPAELTVVMPADPYRIRHDGYPSWFDTRLWVLLVDGQALLLPPLTLEQEQGLLEFIDKTRGEVLLDRSQTAIARLYTGPIPRHLFEPRQVIDYPLDTTFNDEIQLMGYAVRDLDLTPGVMFVTLFWRAVDERPGEDYEIFVQLWNDASEAVANSHSFPYEGMYRSRLWRPDEVVATHHWFNIPEDLPFGRYSLVAGLFYILENNRVPATGGSHANLVEHLAYAPDLRRPLPPPATLGLPPPQPIRFGELFNVIGLDIALDGEAQLVSEVWEVAQGQTLTVDVTWEALARPLVDYSVFLHLSASGDAPPIAQVDQALGETYPSGAWRAGDYVMDRIRLSLPATLESGEYTLWMGIYYWQTGERLPAMLNKIEQPDGRIRLGLVRVPLPAP